MAGRFETFSLASASTLSVELKQGDWPIRAIGIDNPAPFFIRRIGYPGGLAWIAPGVFGAILQMLSGGPIVLTSKDVPPGFAASPTTTLMASITAFEDPLFPSPGAPAAIRPNVYPNQAPATSFQAGLGTTVLVPGVAGQVVYVFSAICNIYVAVAGSAAQLQDTTGYVLYSVGSDALGNFPGDFKGTPLVSGRGLQMSNPGALSARWTVIYSQA